MVFLVAVFVELLVGPAELLWSWWLWLSVADQNPGAVLVVAVVPGLQVPDRMTVEQVRAE